MCIEIMEFERLRKYMYKEILENFEIYENKFAPELSESV